MKQQVKDTAREVLGQFLQERMKDLKMTIYQVKTKAGLHHNQVEAILEGSKNYTIDSLLAVIHALDLYFYFAPKDGKHLDFDDMNKKMDEQDPYH